MKTIKIRYVERDNTYNMQYKSWFGWKDLTYTIDMGYGSITNYYENKDKTKLLNEILEKKFSTIIKFVTIIEYPTIKVY